MLAAPVYAFVATFALLKAASARSCRCARREREEAMGMDVVQHGEEAYATGEGALLAPEAGVELSTGVGGPT